MPIAAADFDLIRDIVLRRSAIVLGDDKQYLVEARVQGLLDDLGLASLEEFCGKLRTQQRGELVEKLVDAMTTNETSFFRDGRPFDALRQEVLPRVIERNAGRRSLNLWSAASSSGQEPVTFTLILKEHFPELDTWDVQILATDISPSMIERCKSGVYSQLEVSRGLPAAMLIKYFDQVERAWRLKPELHRLIEYRRMNVAGPFPTMPELDVVFLRNMLIYFSPETKSQILGNIARVLRPGGYLFLGAAESTRGLTDAFERVPICNDTVVYQKVG